MKISFELSDSDLEHFRQVMISAREKTIGLDEVTIIDNARKLLFQVWHSDTSDFIRERMSRRRRKGGGGGGMGGSPFSLFS